MGNSSSWSVLEIDGSVGSVRSFTECENCVLLTPSSQKASKIIDSLCLEVFRVTVF